MGYGQQNQFDFGDDAPDDSAGGGMNPQIAQGLGMPSPFPTQATQQNVHREFQNIADSASKPTGNSPVNKEAKSKPLFNALTDFTGGAMSSGDLQALMKQVSEGATKSRQQIDQKHRTDLTSLDSFAKILGSAGTEDIDGLVNAVLMHKSMQQAQHEYDQSQRQGAMTDMASGLMGKQDSRIAHQAYLNSKGIQEFGPQRADGNYKALDSWDAIAADRQKQREQFVNQLHQDMTAGLMAHERAGQTQQASNAIQQAMAMAMGNVNLKKGEEELKLMPEEAKNNMAYKTALANPSAGKQLGYLSSMLKSNPELADQIDLGGLFNQMGVGKKPESIGGNDWLGGVKKMIYGDKGGQPGAPAPKQYPGAEPVEIPKAPKPGAALDQNVVNALKAKYKGDKAAAMAEAKRLGWKL